MYVAIGGAGVAALGVWTSLNTPKDDADRRGIGIGLAVGGALLAILGVA
jgi:hypothetical protein